MPQILEHIDKIARDKQRDVLFIDFKNDDLELFNYEECVNRKELIIWLEEHNISYKKCGAMAREHGWESYRGQIYIDLPLDEKNEQYKLLDEHLMTIDNEFKIEGVEFYYLSLEVAMKNSHHDEAGFWDQWAENY